MSNHIARRVIASSALLGALLVSGCGAKSSPKVDPMSGGGNASDKTQQLPGGGTAGANCKSASDCPKASPDVASGGFANTGGLLGFEGEAVPWDFDGVDLKSSDRRVAVLLNAIPAGATVEPAISSSAVYTKVKIRWTPDEKAKSAKPLEVHLRDLDLCEKKLDPALCNNGKKSLDEFDTVVKVNWQIERRDELEDLAANGGGSTGNDDVVQVQDPNCGSGATTDADIQGKILQGAIGVLTGGAGAIPALIPGLLGALGGGGGSSPAPKPC